MTEPVESPESKCPQCGEGLLRSDTSFCRMCESRVKEAKVPNTVGTPYPPLPPLLPGSDAGELEHFQYSLSTLMLAMTLIALLTGLCVSFPGLGIPLTILAIPAWVRTSHALNIEPPDFGSKTSFRNKLDKFVVSMAAMTSVAIAMGIGFFVTCGSVGLVGVVALNNYQNGIAIIMALLSGFAGGSLAALWMLRITWPKRRRPTARQDFHV